MWYYFKGTHQERRQYPYKGIHPLTQESVRFEAISDVYGVLCDLYDEAIDHNFPVGSSLYYQSPYFTSDVNLVNHEIQGAIQGMRYCTLSNTPPFQSFNETPAYYVRQYNWLNSELTSIQNEEQKKNAK